MKLFIVFFLIMFFFGCVSAPDRKDFSNEASYFAAYCFYITKDDAKCLDSEMEARAFNKYLFCLDPKNRPGKKDFEYCWKTLNQK